LSTAFVGAHGSGLEGRLFAASAGDDYALLAALPTDLDPATLGLPERTVVARVGALRAGSPSVAVTMAGRPVDLPARLGFEHRGR
jgi:thiamine-monophosphate kinase